MSVFKMISLSIVIQSGFHNQSVTIKRNHSNSEKRNHMKSKAKRTLAEKARAKFKGGSQFRKKSLPW